MIVDAEEVHNAVNDEQAELASREALHESNEMLMLKLAVAGPYGGNVVVRHLWVDAEAFSNLDDALRTECAFGVCIT